MYQADLNALISRYFSQPERIVLVEAGCTVIEQNGRNERLYYVLNGELEGYYSESGDDLTQIFSAGHGAFIGVHSSFSGTWTASSTVIAKSNVELAWLDRNSQVVEEEAYGPLTAQFTPVIVNELSRRQRRATQEALAKEVALQKLNVVEQMTTLGQLAAGIAHELNNAIGVVSSKSERLESVIMSLLEEVHPEASQFFDYGLMQGQKVSSSDARERGKQLERKYGLDKQLARELARALPNDGTSEHWLKNPQEAIRYWQLGRDLHDLRIASKHTVGIVKSVKQLGRSDVETIEAIDVNESINQAVALLHSDLRHVSVRIRPATLPRFNGSQNELVKVWVNIIKNACDAMHNTDAPEIDIQTKHSKNRILITIANNGSEIDSVTKRKIFDPNFSTKKGGLSFGLGIVHCEKNYFWLRWNDCGEKRYRPNQIQN